MDMSIQFRPANEAPQRGGGQTMQPALILNPCDGYHHVFAIWDSTDDEFLGFFNWLRTSEYGKDCYVAWALLPDELPLIRHFDAK